MKTHLAAFAVFITLPLGASAAGPTYASIVEYGADEIVVRLQQLGSESRAHCTVSTLACTAVDDTYSLANPVVTGPISPDGRYVVYYSAATANNPTRTFTIFDTQTSKAYTKEEKNVTYWDLLSENPRVFSFSPDSKQLLYLSDVGGYAVPYRVQLSNLKGTTFSGTKVISKPYTVTDFGWIDNQTIYYISNRTHPLEWGLYKYKLGSATPTLISAQVSYPSLVRSIGKYLVFTAFEGANATLKRYDTTTGTIAAFSLPSVAAAAGPKYELVKAGSLTGAYWPAAAKSSTLLVWLHGGPYRQTSAGYHSHFSYAGYDWILQEATNAGVGVLRLDYPGSFGYGRKFAESIRLNIGKKDVADTDAAIRAFAQARGFSSIYLIGNSYGGYLAPKLLVEKPQTYDGAFAINGVWDWSSLTHQLNQSIFNVQFNGVENDANKNLYATSEILSRLNNLTTQKVVIAHGEADMTIPYAQSKNAYDTFVLGGKNATFLTFPGEDHVFKQKQNFERLCAEVLKFTNAPTTGRCNLE